MEHPDLSHPLEIYYEIFDRTILSELFLLQQSNKKYRHMVDSYLTSINFSLASPYFQKYFKYTALNSYGNKIKKAIQQVIEYLDTDDIATSNHHLDKIVSTFASVLEDSHCIFGQDDALGRVVCFDCNKRYDTDDDIEMTVYVNNTTNVRGYVYISRYKDPENIGLGNWPYLVDYNGVHNVGQLRTDLLNIIKTQQPSYCYCIHMFGQLSSKQFNDNDTFVIDWPWN